MKQTPLEASSHTDTQKHFPPFMENEGSLPATGTYPEPDESSPQLPTLYA
jgi:hypothetical protein